MDIDDPDCFVEVLVAAPVPCSDPCEIEFSYFEIGECYDSGTGNTIEDDTFSISFVVDTILGNTSQYWVEIGTNSYGPFTYGDTISISNLIANGEDLTAVITDDINGSCYAEMTFSQNPCSSCDQTIDAGVNQELSCLDPLLTLTGTSSEAGIYAWSGPNSFSENDISVQVDVAGWYYFEVSYDDGCYQIDSLEVSLDANAPMSNAGPDLTITCLVDTVSLDGSLSSSGNGIYL